MLRDTYKSKAMDFEEPVQITVDPEVRAYVYSLVSAVSRNFSLMLLKANNTIAWWDGR